MTGWDVKSSNAEMDQPYNSNAEMGTKELQVEEQNSPVLLLKLSARLQRRASASLLTVSSPPQDTTSGVK